MSAIQAMKQELKKLQQAQNECVTESGIVKSGCRAKFTLLVAKARSFRESIEWMEEQTNCK